MVLKAPGSAGDPAEGRLWATAANEGLPEHPPLGPISATSVGRESAGGRQRRKMAAPRGTPHHPP